MIAITLTIDSRPANVALVSEALRGLCTLTALSQAEIERLCIGVVEAVNNAILHAYEARPGHPITVTWTITGRCLRIGVTDRGRPMTAPPAREWPAAEIEGGRGGPIMWTCADRLECTIEGRSKTVTLIKYLPMTSERDEEDMDEAEPSPP